MQRIHRLLLILLLGLSATAPAAPSNPNPSALTSSNLFSSSKVWTVHLEVAADQWTEMEPKGGQAGLGALFGGAPQPATAANPAARQGQGGAAPAAAPGGAGLLVGLFVTPAFLREGDADKDAKLSKTEFTALGKKWFEQWDTTKSDALPADRLTAGMNQVFTVQNLFGPPAAGTRAGQGGALGGMFSLQGAAGQPNGLAARLGIEFTYVHANVDIGGIQLKDVGLRYKGNGTFVESRATVKRPFKLDLNRNTKGQKLAGETKLNLHNNVADPGWMNEVLSFRLFQEAGVPSPRTAYAKVYVTVPGKYDRQYFGLYTLVEDIDNNFLTDRFGTNTGALFKPSTPALFADLGDDWAKYQQTYDPKNDVSEKAKQRVIDFSKLVTKASDEEFAAKVGAYVDLDAFARFLGVTVSLSALDSIIGIGQNYYLYLDPKTERFRFIPWDQDHSFGQLFGSQEQRENLSIHQPWQGENRFLEQLFKVSAFKELYQARLGEFARNSFTPERLARQVDELAAIIRPAVAEESDQKLARFEASVAGQIPPTANTGFGGQGGKPIKAFMPARSKSLLDQLSGQSTGLVVGGMGVPAATPAGPNQRAGRAGIQAAPQTPGFGQLLAPVFLTAMDADKNGSLNSSELGQGFDRWFTSWNNDSSGLLTSDQISAGLGALMPAGLGGLRGARGP